MKKGYKIFWSIIFVGVAAFGIFKYVVTLKEKYDLLNALRQVKEEVAALENEKQDLLEVLEQEKVLEQQVAQKNVLLKKNLKAGLRKISQLQKTNEEAGYKIQLLKSENIVLRERNTTLAGQVDQAQKEKYSIQAQLKSVEEIKKAIWELKGQLRKIRGEILRRHRTDTSLEGNCGFLIKNGKSTYQARVRIEVSPVQ